MPVTRSGGPAPSSHQFLHVAAVEAARGGLPARAEIVAAVDAACIGALAGACATVFAGVGRLPVLAHVAGGDDVLVSVPARDGWSVARRLASGFTSLLDAATERWPEPVRRQLPSMSVGLVFHHRSAPFPDMVRLARQQLGVAKRELQGREAALAFLDTTADGDRPPGSRRPVPVAELARMSQRLSAAAALPAAQAATLLSLLRGAELGDAGQGGRQAGSGVSPAATLARRVRDLGAEVLWRVAVDAADGRQVAGDRVEAALRDDPAARIRLRTVLDVARWWQPDTTDAADRPAAAASLGAVAAAGRGTL